MYFPEIVCIKKIWHTFLFQKLVTMKSKQKLFIVFNRVMGQGFLFYVYNLLSLSKTYVWYFRDNNYEC